LVLSGHIFKEIKRKVRVCVIEEGRTPDQCVDEIDKDYELNKEEKNEVKELAKSIGKR